MHKSKAMRSIPVEEQPYEKAMLYGIDSLSDAELLAVIIRNGSTGSSALATSYELLDRLHGLSGLCDADESLLREVKGIGTVKVLQLRAVGELSRRIWKHKNGEALVCDSPQKIYQYYREEMRYLPQEEVWLLLLDNKLQRIREVVVARGTVNYSPVAPRDIFRIALRNQAVSFVLMHNHPSGDPSPSRDDRELTNRIRSLGDMLELPMTDHIIFGDNCFYSFNDSV